MKRCFDVVVAGAALLVLLPIILAVALLVRIYLGSPVIFRHRRPGLGGAPFALYKFRTMTHAQDAGGRLLPDGQRLTRLGRFLRATSLDELPELVNVLRGEMSLVGPRPLHMHYLPHFTERERVRHEVRPGISGWAQVNGRNLLPWNERLALDVWYVEHRSFALDLRILARTFLQVITMHGAAPDADTVETDLAEERRRGGGSATVNVSNPEIYATVELDRWSHRTDLIPAERFLLERYLNKEGRTLDAGTGNGRLLFALRALGFSALSGFDVVGALLDHGRQRDATGSIRFDLQNAVSLHYADASFEQIMYLQQVICFIEDEPSRRTALREAARVLRTGGTALFSFLSYEARSRSAMYWAYLAYLRFVRAMRRSAPTLQSLPWLRRAGRFNPGALVDAGPYLYWYRLDEICRLLEAVGFAIEAVGSTRQILEDRIPASPEALAREPIEGMLYVVARK